MAYLCLPQSCNEDLFFYITQWPSCKGPVCFCKWVTWLFLFLSFAFFCFSSHLLLFLFLKQKLSNAITISCICWACTVSLPLSFTCPIWPQHPMLYTLPLPILYGCANWGWQGVNDMSCPLQCVSGRDGIWTKAAWFYKACSVQLLSLSCTASLQVSLSMSPATFWIKGVWTLNTCLLYSPHLLAENAQ